MDISSLATRMLGHAEIFLKKNGPTILTGAGVAGFIATTALTIKATTKALEVMPQISSDIRKAREVEADETFNEHDRMKNLVQVYMDSSVKLAKVYSPVLAVGVVSIICVVSAHGMMLKRQASLVAAYSALDAGFRAYRKRVAEKIGADEELELYRRPSLRALYENDQDDDRADDACQIDFDDPMPSPYARYFCDGNPNWSKTGEYNLMFLRAQQQFANDRLRAHGFVFLNEVYEMLGLERAQYGQIVGWKYKRDGKNDGFVDFGLYAIGDEGNRAFVNLIEPTVLLDFNVDGIITI